MSTEFDYFVLMGKGYILPCRVPKDSGLTREKIEAVFDDVVKDMPENELTPEQRAEYEALFYVKQQIMAQKLRSQQCQSTS